MSPADPAPSGTTPESPAPSTSEAPSGTSTEAAPRAASTRPFINECRVEIEINKRRKAVPRGLRINGFSIPNVVSAVASYIPMQPRRVTIVLMPTDVIEIDTESEQSSANGGTVDDS